MWAHVGKPQRWCRSPGPAIAWDLRRRPERWLQEQEGSLGWELDPWVEGQSQFAVIPQGRSWGKLTHQSHSSSCSSQSPAVLPTCPSQVETGPGCPLKCADADGGGVDPRASKTQLAQPGILFHLNFTSSRLNEMYLGLPWWSSDWDSQSRGPGFHPWSGN